MELDQTGDRREAPVKKRSLAFEIVTDRYTGRRVPSDNADCVRGSGRPFGRLSTGKIALRIAAKDAHAVQIIDYEQEALVV